jgi:hypothetical protein
VEQVPDHKPVEAYIPHGHVPFAEPVSQSYFKAAEELLLPFPATGLQSFPKLDSQIIGGFRPNEFSILCGATGTGKTTLIANWSASWLKQGVPHFVASVETGRTDFVKRVMSAMVDEDWNTGEAVPLAKVRAFSRDHDEAAEGRITAPLALRKPLQRRNAHGGHRLAHQAQEDQNRPDR